VDRGILFTDNLGLMDADDVPRFFDYTGLPPSEECCCVSVPCCDRALPRTLTLSLTNTADCPCIDGVSILLVWDAADSAWIGTGAGGFGTCTVDTAEWRLVCSSDGVPPVDCLDFKLILNGPVGGGGCIVADDFAATGCTCEPLFLHFTINASGIGCCNAIPGNGTITAIVTE
jgi:hypothetical protein